MENKKETKKEKIMQVIDVFFVMILCFVVLLVTMLFQNLAGVKEAGKAYVIPGIYTGAGCSCAGSICNISCEKKQKRFKGNY